MDDESDNGCGLTFLVSGRGGRVCIEAFCICPGIPKGESREGCLRKFSTEIRRDNLFICGGAGVEKPSERTDGGCWCDEGGGFVEGGRVEAARDGGRRGV